jgi:hypothetical protein
MEDKMAAETIRPKDSQEEQKEDYALRVTPKHWRWPWYSVMNVALGLQGRKKKVRYASILFHRDCPPRRKSVLLA